MMLLASPIMLMNLVSNLLLVTPCILWSFSLMKKHALPLLESTRLLYTLARYGLFLEALPI